jgi:hypothetical protein
MVRTPAASRRRRAVAAPCCTCLCRALDRRCQSAWGGLRSSMQPARRASPGRAGRDAPLQVGHVFSDHCVTGPVVGEAIPERPLPGSSSRVSSAETSTAWNSSGVSWATTAKPGCGGKSQALSPSSSMKLFRAALPGRPRCDRGWPSAAPAPPRRPVSRCSRRGGYPPISRGWRSHRATRWPPVGRHGRLGRRQGRGPSVRPPHPSRPRPAPGGRGS